MQGALRPWRLDERRTFTRHVVTDDIRAVLALSGLPRVGRARLRAILQCIRERDSHSYGRARLPARNGTEGEKLWMTRKKT